jgi:hypothetical protein
MYNSVISANQGNFRKAIFAKTDLMSQHPNLSPVGSEKIVAQFDGGLLLFDACVLALGEVEKKLRIADCFAAYVVDSSALDQVTHMLTDIIRPAC